MKILSLPQWGMNEAHISQTYHEGHKALDIIPASRTFFGYGVPLTAPEMVRIERITGDTFTPGNEKNLERGYGIWMKGLETGFTHLYWHVLPILPVWGGDVIARGKIVAYMGNAGLVRRNGVYVPLEQRTTPAFPGTHLHWEMFDSSFSFKKAGHEVNQIPHLNFLWQPTYTNTDQLAAAALVLKKMAKKLG